MLVKSEDRKMSEAIHTVYFSLEQEVASVSQSGCFIFYLLSKNALVSHGLAAQDLTWIFALLTPCTFWISAQMSFLREPSSHPDWGFLPPALPQCSLSLHFVLFSSQHLSLFEIVLFLYWPVYCLSLLPLGHKFHGTAANCFSLFYCCFLEHIEQCLAYGRCFRSSLSDSMKE